MSSHDMDGMDQWDVYLGRSLRDWLAQYTPPVDGKEKLLQHARSLPTQPLNLNTFLHTLVRNVFQKIFSFSLLSSNYSTQLPTVYINSFISQSDITPWSTELQLLQSLTTRRVFLFLLH
jgi:hypothetical protein